VTAKSTDESGRIGDEAAAWHTRMLEPRSDAEVEAFEAWLAADPAHARAYAALDRISTASEDLPRRLLLGSAQPGRSRLRPAFGVAVAALLATSTCLWLAGGLPPATGAALANAGPGVRGHILGDGSRLTLDVGARVSVPQAPEPRELVLLAGRVRIGVAPGSAAPLIVDAEGARISAAEGVFDVSRQDGQLMVQVLAGRIDIVVPPMGGWSETRRALERDEVLQLRAGQIATSQSGLIDAEWPEARASFDNAPLAAVVARANRLRGPALVLTAPETGARRVTAVLDLRDKPSLARKLAAALDLSIEQDSGRLLLSPR